mmetsp:Transcript_1246/g.5310  ORF Transcript_1246/g.5310 Transcript_1246/m.5310 type:complete len:368 (+) Transcript_1246:4317-5420(+)
MSKAHQDIALHGGIDGEHYGFVGGVAPGNLVAAFFGRLRRGRLDVAGVPRRCEEQHAALEDLQVRAAALRCRTRAVPALQIPLLIPNARNGVHDASPQQQGLRARLHAVQHVGEVLQISPLRRDGEVFHFPLLSVAHELQPFHGAQGDSRPGQVASKHRGRPALAAEAVDDGDVGLALEVLVQLHTGQARGIPLPLRRGQPAVHAGADLEQQAQWRRGVAGEEVLQHLVVKARVVIGVLGDIPDHESPRMLHLQVIGHDVDVIALRSLATARFSPHRIDWEGHRHDCGGNVHEIQAVQLRLRRSPRHKLAIRDRVERVQAQTLHNTQRFALRSAKRFGRHRARGPRRLFRCFRRFSRCQDGGFPRFL